MNQIQTFTGKWVEPLALKAEDIDIRDIAHALSRICRFNGQCHGFLNVAQHSVRVMMRMTRPGVGNREKLTALMHDAAEAYLGDIVRPLKKHPAFAFYREAEAKAEALIAEKFGLIYPFPESVKWADEDEIANEVKHLRYAAYIEHPSTSESEFLFWFNSLSECV